MTHHTPTTRVADMTEEELVRTYLDVSNRAMDKHADSFPFKQLISLGHRIIGDRSIALGIYKDDSSNVYDYYSFRLENGTFRLAEHGKADEVIEWKASRAYLEEVAGNPDEYIESPTKLDLDWIKSRLGMDID